MVSAVLLISLGIVVCKDNLEIHDFFVTVMKYNLIYIFNYLDLPENRCSFNPFLKIDNVFSHESVSQYVFDNGIIKMTFVCVTIETQESEV